MPRGFHWNCHCRENGNPKIKNFGFSGVKLEVQGLLNEKGYHKRILKSLNPDLVSLNIKNDSIFLSDKKVIGEKASKKKYIQLFDCYGEVCLKNSFYFKE